jgi:FlaA1/EpsC-like NDP-sugar epimerase
VAFWLAHWVRDLGYVTEILQRDDIHPFSTYAWLLLVIIPAAPFILQAQGYYDRPLMASRRRFSGSFSGAASGRWFCLVLISFLFRLQPARGVILLFGPISFLLLLLTKEEIIRRWVTSGVGQAQLRRRLILVGAAADTEKVRRELVEPAQMSLEVIAEVDLNRTTVDEFLRIVA